jgi:hypothetical protein
MRALFARNKSTLALTPEVSGLIQEMQAARIDRERTALLVGYLTDPENFRALPRVYSDINLVFACFDFPESVNQFLTKLRLARE